MAPIPSFFSSILWLSRKATTSPCPQPKNKEPVPLSSYPSPLSLWSCRLVSYQVMSLNSSITLSMPVNPEALGHGWKGNKNIFVSESSYPMNNVPTCQITIQSYALEGNKVIPRDNTIYYRLRKAVERVYVSPSTGGTEARVTGCGPLPSEISTSFRTKESRVCVSPSRGSQLQVNTGILSALNAHQVIVLTLFVFPLA